MYATKVMLVFFLAATAVNGAALRTKRFIKFGEAYQHKVVPQRSILYLVPEPVYVPVRVPAPAAAAYAPAMASYSAPPQQPYAPPSPMSYAQPSPPMPYAMPAPY